jgi:hypothetical protein
MAFKKGHIPHNKGKTNIELGIQRSSVRRISSFTDADKRQFIELNQSLNINEIAKHFKMRIGDACTLQRELCNEYALSFKNHNRKITKYQATKILVERLRDGVPQKDLAIKYGIAPCNVSNICAGRSWKHIFQGAKKRYNDEILSIADKGDDIKAPQPVLRQLVAAVPSETLLSQAQSEPATH